MDLSTAINKLYSGSTLDINSKEEYEKIRTGIQEQAGRWIDAGQAMRAIIALEEIKRLDAKFAN